jgi:hypothetical protein
MALDQDQADALRAELADTAYDDKTADQAFVLLNEPEPITRTEDTHTRLTALGIAGVLGAARWPPFLTALRAALGPNYPDFMREGVDISHPDTAVFLQQMLEGGAAEEEDVNTLLALATREVTEYLPPRISRGPFLGVAGMPNRVDRADFDSLWAEVRGG